MGQPKSGTTCSVILSADFPGNELSLQQVPPVYVAPTYQLGDLNVNVQNYWQNNFG